MSEGGVTHMGPFYRRWVALVDAKFLRGLTTRECAEMACLDRVLEAAVSRTRAGRQLVAWAIRHAGDAP